MRKERTIKQLRYSLKRAIEKQLPPLQQDVLKMRFGLVDGTHYTLRRIGGAYGLSGEYIRQVQIRALKKLNF